jgi:hypothetical protein
VPQQGWPIAAPHAAHESGAPLSPATHAKPVEQVPVPNGPPGPPPPVRGQHASPAWPQAWQVRGVAVAQVFPVAQVLPEQQGSPVPPQVLQVPVAVVLAP